MRISLLLNLSNTNKHIRHTIAKHINLYNSIFEITIYNKLLMFNKMNSKLSNPLPQNNSIHLSKKYEANDDPLK